MRWDESVGHSGSLSAQPAGRGQRISFASSSIQITHSL